jgi:hypothetical protein
MPNEIIDLQPVPESNGLQPDRIAQRVMTEVNSVADLFRVLDEDVLSKKYEKAIARAPAKHEAALRGVFKEIDAGIQRRLRPWPKWVLRLAAELYAVSCPTIPKEKILEGFELIHFLFFDWRFDESVPFPAHKFESFDPAIFGSVFGHVVALMENFQGKADYCLRANAISVEEYNEFKREIAFERYVSEVNEYVTAYTRHNPQFLIRFSEALAHAKANTFDKKGNRKELPRMAIYERIFEQWPEVEAMSGVTEFCKFLEPLLNEPDPEKRLNRTKSIRRQFGIVFEGKVRGLEIQRTSPVN